MQAGLKYQVYTKCFVCNSDDLHVAYDFGNVPLADYLVTEGEDYHIPAYPLHLNYCNSCGFLFLKEGVNQEVLFNSDYPYYTSVNPSLVEHFRKAFFSINYRKKVEKNSVVIEAASNDGYLLQHFLEAGARVLGVEPSGGPANTAKLKGVNTIVDFFTKELAIQLAAQGWQADFFVGNNVLAHVKDPNNFIAGVKLLLKAAGLGVFEFPYKKRMFEKVEFDTIFHQHLCYFSMIDIIKLFEKNGLTVTDAEEIEIHGGSLRIYVKTQGEMSERLIHILKKEKEIRLNGKESLTAFLDRTKVIRTDLNEFIAKAERNDKVIYGYGAAGKANTLLSYCQIYSDKLPLIIDISPHKQGKYFSTGQIPIRNIDFLKNNPPDYLLILAWNFAEDIINALRYIVPTTTKFVIPIPYLRIV